jgi:hypothetical protein
VLRLQLAQARIEHATHPAETGEEFARQVHGRETRYAATEQDGKKFRVR